MEGTIRTSKRKYLVSGDLRAIVSRWIGDNGPFYLPDKQMFEKLQAALVAKLSVIMAPRDIEVVYLPWDYLKTGMLVLISKHAGDCPIISLDNVYVEKGVADIYFDTNRIVKWSKHDAEADWFGGWSEIGRGSRSSALGIAAQIDRIVNQGRIRRMQDKRVVVVDEGTWTLQSLVAFQKLLAEFDIRVEKFIVGIEIRPSQESKAEEEVLGRPFYWVEKYAREDVVDWVGERDFFPGVGLSGRKLGEKLENISDSETMRQHYYAVPMEGNYGAPYLLPLGDPVAWANVPREKAKEFSLHCLDLTIQMYQAIEAETKRITKNPTRIRVKDLERPPYFFRKQADESVVDELIKAKQYLMENFK